MADDKRPLTSSIGSLTTELENTLSTTRLTQTESSKTSETGQPMQPQPNDEKNLPVLFGNRGYVERVNEQIPTQVANRSVKDRTSEALWQLELLCGCEIKSETNSVYDQHGSFSDLKISGYAVTKPIERCAVAQCRAIVRYVTQPASYDDVAKILGAMLAIYPSKIPDEDDTTGAIWLSSVWRFIQEYPNDVIAEAIDNIMKSDTFLPMPNRFVRECNNIGSARMAMKNIKFRVKNDGR